VPYRGKRDETINLNTFHDILVSGAGDQTVKLWDTAKGAEVATLYGHTDYVRAVRFSRDGNTIYSTGFGADHQLRFWSAATLKRSDVKIPMLATP